MRGVKRAAVLLAALGTAMIAAGIAYARIFPVTPTNDTVCAETLYFSGVRELVAVTGTLPIRVEPAEGDVCEVSYQSALPLIADMDEFGTLRLTQDDSFSLSLLTRRQRDFHLTVKLPDKSYERISLATSGGAVDCAPVSCGLLEISTRSGAISLEGADQRAKIRTESGAVTLGLNALSGDMTITAGAGDVRLTMPSEIPFCLKFLTERGRLIRDAAADEDAAALTGDAALVRGEGGYLLTVTTSDGDLELRIIE